MVVVLLTVAVATACSSSASSPNPAAGGTGNKVNPAWPAMIVVGGSGEASATALLQTLGLAEGPAAGQAGVRLTVESGTSYPAMIKA